MFFRCVLFTLCIFVSCKSPKVAASQQQTRATSGSPMTCRIKGKIIERLTEPITDNKDICTQHPCEAIVEIMEQGNCGTSVTLKYQQGEHVKMKFRFTLDDTKMIFPSMKSHFPGLKVGDVFSATVHQQLEMGSDGIFIVYEYERL